MSQPETPDTPAVTSTLRPAAAKNVGGKSRQRDAERPPADLADQRRRIWTRLDPEYRFTPHYVRWDGQWLHFLDEGNSQAPALLLLHGNPTWSFLWRRQIEALRERFRVIALDLPGMGFSERTPGRTRRLAEHVAAVEFLVGELGLERLALGLHDWGGPIGLGFARRHPEAVRAVALFNTAAFPFPKLPGRLALARSALLGPPLVRGLGLFNRGLLRVGMTQRGPLSAVERRGYLAPYARPADREQVLAFVQDIPMEPAHPSYAELAATGESLAGLAKLPRLLVWGERDPVFHGEILAEWRRRWPDAEYLTLPRAGHLAMEDEPAAVNQALLRFFERWARG